VVMKIVVERARELMDEVWLIRLGPNDVQHLGEIKNAAGEKSVVLASNPHYDSASHELRFDGSDVTVLNMGTSLDTIVIGVRRDHGAGTKPDHGASNPKADLFLGPGDQEFLDMVARKLAGRPREAAEHLLRRVRSNHPGDLRRGKRLEFSDRPDNVWHIAVQPRPQSIRIRVRGEPKRFLPSPFHLQPYRHGHTRFVIDRLDEVDEALRIIDDAGKKWADNQEAPNLATSDHR